MAVLYISEYVNEPVINGRFINAASEPAIAEQHVAIGSTSTASAAFNVLTKFVRIHTDAICSIAFGASPTAVATAKRLAANSTEYFGVPPLLGYSVAVITNT